MAVYTSCCRSGTHTSCEFVVDDVSLEFKGSFLSLDTDPICQKSDSDGHLLLKTVLSKVFAEQLTCKDAVSRLFVYF